MMVNLPLFRMKSSATSNHFPFIIHLRSRLAKCWTTFPARLTMPATRNKCTDDMIALLKICDPFTYLNDFSSSFMTYCHRCWSRSASINEGEIRLTYYNRSDQNLNF